MKKSVVYREFQSGDAPFLEDIIRKTWQYDRFCSPKTAKRMARLYLANCLAAQTFTQVAVLNGTPAGIIMGRDGGAGTADKKQDAFHKKRRQSLRFILRRMWAACALLAGREGRAVGRAFSEINGVDQALLTGRGKEYGGELVFFAVNENYRGAGIGKGLFHGLLKYMESRNIQSFYLYTDSSCNYGFYEHQGMKRCGEKVFSVPIGVDNEMKFYLYEYEREKEERNSR